MEYESNLKISIMQIPTLNDTAFDFTIPSKEKAFEIIEQRTGKRNNDSIESTKTLNIIIGTCSILGVGLLLLLFKSRKKLYDTFMIRKYNGTSINKHKTVLLTFF